MGFFDKIKASVGIGGAKLEAHFTGSGYRPGGMDMVGRVVLKGGKVEQTCNVLTVRIKRVRELTEREHAENEQAKQNGTSAPHSPFDEFPEVKLAGTENFKIAPESTNEFTFVLPLPDDGKWGSNPVAEFVAAADIPGAIDPFVSLEVPLAKS